MARPRRIKSKPEGDRYEMKEREPTALILELFANDNYHGDQCLLSIYDGNEPEAGFQTTLSELEEAISEFKKMRGIKRVRR